MSSVETAVDLRVRDAKREDMPLLLKMIQELAAFEGFPDALRLTADDLVKDGFDSSPPWFFALLAESGGRCVGYALYNHAYSSWTRRALFVEDMFIAPDARRLGVGSALARAVFRRAAQVGSTRVDWHVLESNAPAIAFYRGLGARDLRQSEGRTVMRLDEEHILRLAAEQDTCEQCYEPQYSAKL